MTLDDTQALTVTKSGLHEQAMLMRYSGANCKEIAERINVSHGTVRNWFASGGLLDKPYEKFKTTQASKVKDTAVEITEKAKRDAHDAYQRQVNLAQSAANEAVQYKGNEFIIGLAGVSADKTLKEILNKLTYEDAKRKLNQQFVEVYGRSIEEKERKLSSSERETIIREFEQVIEYRRRRKLSEQS